MKVTQKIKNRTIYDPVITHLGIYPKESKSAYSRDTCIPMFIRALFTTSKLWSQPRCPSTDAWRKEMWCTYTTELYLAIKKN
jgi:hypothetical protein